MNEISNNVVCATSKASDQPAHTRSLIRAFASRLNIIGLLSYIKGGRQARLSLLVSKFNIVGNHMSRLIYLVLALINADHQKIDYGTWRSSNRASLCDVKLTLML